MAELERGAQLTLLELAKRTNNAELLGIVEALEETNEILQDAVWLPGNDLTSHVVNIRDSLPSGTWRAINEDVSPEASTTHQDREEIGMLESYMEIDVALAALAPNPRRYLMDEEKAFLEGMGQTYADTIIYGDQITNPSAFDGFDTRYPNLSDNDAKGRDLNFDGGGSGSDTMSLWIIQWGPRKVYMVYPRNSRTLGIQRKFLGQTTKESSTGLREVFRTWFKFNGGLVIEDDRCIKRIANIETSGSSNTLDEDLIIEALNKMPNQGRGSRLYTNRTGMTQFDILAKDKTNVNYNPNAPFGQPLYTFRTHPIRLCDALLDTETAIT